MFDYLHSCIQATFSAETCYLMICSLDANAYKPWQQPPWPRNLAMKHLKLSWLILQNCMQFSTWQYARNFQASHCLSCLKLMHTSINSRHGVGCFSIVEVMSFENTLSNFPYQSCCRLHYLNHWYLLDRKFYKVASENLWPSHVHKLWLQLQLIYLTHITAYWKEKVQEESLLISGETLNKCRFQSFSVVILILFHLPSCNYCCLVLLLH